MLPDYPRGKMNTMHNIVHQSISHMALCCRMALIEDTHKKSGFLNGWTTKVCPPPRTLVHIFFHIFFPLMKKKFFFA